MIIISVLHKNLLEKIKFYPPTFQVEDDLDAISTPEDIAPSILKYIKNTTTWTLYKNIGDLKVKKK
jgi:alpha-N-acetylglucosamine transferase